MKQFILFFVMSCFPLCLFAQVKIGDYAGEWMYQGNDTAFTIKLQVVDAVGFTRESNNKKDILGGYSLKKGNVVLQDYIRPIPATWNIRVDVTDNNAYIWGRYDEQYHPNFLGISFYDQVKRHFDGDGITGGSIEYLSMDRIRWKLDEATGIYIMTEGDESGKEVLPIGFSVPSDVIMTKVK